MGISNYVETKTELDQLFEEHNKENENFILVQLTASWCPPCKRISAEFEQNTSWIDKYEGKLKWCKIDVDKMSEDEDLSKIFSPITSVPKFILFKGFKGIGVVEGADKIKILNLIYNKMAE
jgi:thiol-disulfide isomerase/thioredoxin